MHRVKNSQWLTTTIPQTVFFFFPFYSSSNIHIQIYTQRTIAREGWEKVADPLYKDLAFPLCYGLSVSSPNFYIETQPQGEGIKR